MKEQFHGKMLEETFQERVENMVAKKNQLFTRNKLENVSLHI